MTAKVILEWRNLNLVIEKKEFNFSKCRTSTEEKLILDNVSGSLKSGQLVAILGSSGAGKTTLLAGISQRFRGPLTGRILVNGNEIDRRTMTKISCFVPQFDITMNTLTPSEHLYFMAELKLDRKWTRSRKNQRIDFLLRELGLQHVANNRISTLSGGERKKLNLAVDLLTNPPIIFCDEPTTGLDSFNARKVIEALKYLSSVNSNDTATTSTNVENDTLDNGYGMELTPTKHHMPAKAIICSIHQPTSQIFECFSHIILMYAGRCVFYGTTEEAFTHFSKLGFDCPRTYNPADFYLKVLSNTTQQEEGQYRKFFEKPIEILRRSSTYKPPNVADVERFNVKDYKIRGPFWIEQVWALMKRSFLNIRRSYREIFIDIAWYLIPFFVMAALYHETTGNTQKSIQDVDGALFIMACEVIFTTCYSVINFYPSLMPILRRETNEHIYSFSAHYVAEVFNVIPVAILRSFTGILILYLWSGFMNFWIFMKIGITLLIASFAANAYGLLISGILKTVITDIASVFDLIFLCLSGIYMNLSSLPYARYFSPFFYTNEALLISFWSNVTEIECPPKYDGNCLKNGTEVLQSLSYSTSASDVWFDYVGLFVLGLIMHLFAYLGIRRNITSVGYY